MINNELQGIKITSMSMQSFSKIWRELLPGMSNKVLVSCSVLFRFNEKL
jgi:hypothetical protein